MRFCLVLLSLLFCSTLAMANPMRDHCQGKHCGFYIQFEKTQIRLDTGAIQDIQAHYDKRGRALVEFTLTDECAVKFENLTRDNIGKSAQLIFDGRVISNPVVRAPIVKSMMISGLSAVEAHRLVHRVKHHHADYEHQESHAHQEKAS